MPSVLGTKRMLTGQTRVELAPGGIQAASADGPSNALEHTTVDLVTKNWVLRLPLSHTTHHHTLVIFEQS